MTAVAVLTPPVAKEPAEEDRVVVVLSVDADEIDDIDAEDMRC